MNFEKFLRDLCLVELSDLVYTDPDADIPEEYPSTAFRLKLLPTINSALRQLYINYQIEQKELVLRTDVNITTYTLSPDHALTNPAPVDKYIIDNVLNPFTGDLARVDEILDERGYRVYSAEDNKMGGNIRTPRWDQISFQTPIDGAEYLVRYRVKAPEMVNTQVDCDIMLNLPPGFTELLRLKIAEIVYANKKTPENIALSEQYRARAAVLEASLTHQDVVQEGGWNFDDRAAAKGFI